MLTAEDYITKSINAPTGVSSFSTTVKTVPRYIIPTRATYSIYYGENNSTEPLRITNRGQNQGIAKGYPVTDPSAINAVSNNPEIFTVRPNGTIQPTGVGTGTMTVSLYGSDPVTLTVIVDPQSGGGRGIGATSYYFSVVIDGKQLSSSYAYKAYSGLDYKYTGNPIKPHVEKVIDTFGNVLTEGKDYTVKYLDNTEPGVGTVLINGVNNYTGTLGDYTFGIDEPDPIPDDSAGFFLRWLNTLPSGKILFAFPQIDLSYLRSRVWFVQP